MTAPRRLRWEDWPAADQALWKALVRHGGLLDDAGALSHLRPSTMEIIQAALRPLAGVAHGLSARGSRRAAREAGNARAAAGMA